MGFEGDEISEMFSLRMVRKAVEELGDNGGRKLTERAAENTPVESGQVNGARCRSSAPLRAPSRALRTADRVAPVPALRHPGPRRVVLLEPPAEGHPPNAREGLRLRGHPLPGQGAGPPRAHVRGVWQGRGSGGATCAPCPADPYRW